jgi:hypothetical protein
VGEDENNFFASLARDDDAQDGAQLAKEFLVDPYFVGRGGRIVGTRCWVRAWWLFQKLSPMALVS